MDGVLYDENPTDVVQNRNIFQESSHKKALRSRDDLKLIRLLSVVAAILHVLISIILVEMGFEDFSFEGQTEKSIGFSLTIVFCAFAALVTCIWACVGSWEIFAGSNKIFELPSWNWHNNHFVSALIVGYSLTFVLWPAIVTFIIHSRQNSFWTLVLTDFEVNTAVCCPENVVDCPIVTPRFTLGPLILHMLAGPVSLLLCVLGIFFPTRWLQQLQDSEEEDVDEEDMTLPNTAKYLIGAKLIMDIVLLLDFALLIPVGCEINSGLVWCAIIQGICMLPFWALFKASRASMNLDVETWLWRWRFASIVQLFMITVVCWVAACLFILTTHFTSQFWEFLKNRQVGTVYLPIALFFGLVIAYGLMLRAHSRCMESLDTIASLHLIEKHGAGDEMDMVEEDDDEVGDESGSD
eukprot:CAMPEP_0175140216 /NCGR_PEP_ID=MMETSP0087-20121206/11339_1 /TAXON_ID=136419 /ORGANISM="Unknown Unknown, Strain D1" /LENGTH=408 /DNA_ID=CAMNT_0016423321 /DNA_START=24 /DNA_END=1250 /DNA_ORIENTATION=-